MPRLLDTLREDWPRLALDIVVLILGISLSFELEQWRQDRENAQLERRAWRAVHDDLVADTLTLVGYSRVLATEVRACDALLGTPPADSIGTYMAHVLSYPAFRPATAAYEELRQSSNAREIRHRRLFNTLTRLHTGAYVATADWDHVDAQLVVERFFPYIEANAPPAYADSAGETKTGVAFRETWRALHTRPQFRNLLGTSRSFKNTHHAMYQFGLDDVRRVLARVDSVLADSSASDERRPAPAHPAPAQPAGSTTPRHSPNPIRTVPSRSQ